MDVKTALLNSVSFPLSPRQVEVISTQRGLDVCAEFSKETGRSKDFQLAKADMIRTIVTAPNISEGGVSISISDRRALIGMANSIYSRFEPESIILEQCPTVEPIYD